jgi:hypothetical protein
MPAYYRAAASNFASAPAQEIVGALSTSIIREFTGDHSRQLASWQTQVRLLQTCLRHTADKYPNAHNWGILFEYPLLRLQRRLDVVILAGTTVVVIEFKVGGDNYLTNDIQQVEDYALDLRDFHEASHHLPILPVLCVTNAADRHYELPDGDGVANTCLCNAESLFGLLQEVAALGSPQQISLDTWDASPYRPVPSIIEAAELLFAGHEVQEIAHASSDPENLGATTDRLIDIISSAQRNSEHAVVFVTGVPGSGKTLVGLNAIHDPRFRDDNRAAGAFLSGNTPLVRVLRDALARDEASRTKKTLQVARREVRAKIQGLMDYLKEYLDSHPNEAPVDHVIVFDEAQRAWDADYGAQKFDRQKSEPALFLEIMGRHTDWAVIVALVGGGQEINRGEKGLSEWGSAITAYNAEVGYQKWRAIAAPDVVEGSDATAWQTLSQNDQQTDWIERDDRLHLAVSVRSYRCLATTKWVNALLDGRIDQARSFAAATDEFPIFLTRSLDTARDWLRTNSRGTRRCGLVASSGARRLRAEGLGVSLSANDLPEVVNWYLLPRGDIRSSNALEVTANEYTCQGLELDYVGVCWDGDLIWSENTKHWIHRRLGGSKWQTLKDKDRQLWLRNKYRVLLTRARLGTVIWIPCGNPKDDTRSPETLDQIANVLLDAGATILS